VVRLTFGTEPLSQYDAAWQFQNYRFFLGFFCGGGTTGLLLIAITSCMIDAMRMFVSEGHFFAGFFMPPSLPFQPRRE
jgi:hypothetical protein